MPLPAQIKTPRRYRLPQRGFGLAVVLLLAGGLPFVSRAADYLVDVWDTENELPSSSVTSVAQTPDGYLWVGTYNGLARFDGVRFVTFDPVTTPQLDHARIQSLVVDAQGTLWINTFRGGLTSFRGGSFHREWPGRGEFDTRTTLAWESSNTLVFATQAGEVVRREAVPGSTNANWRTFTPAGGARLTYECADGVGGLWFLSRDGQQIFRFAAGAFKPIPFSGRVSTLAADARGVIWVGASNLLSRWDGTQFETRTPTNSEPPGEVMTIVPTRDGGAWVLANGRLRKLWGRRWVAEAAAWNGLLGPASGHAMGAQEDREGGVWFNHYGNGLFHVTPDGKFQRFTSAEGLPGERIWAWFQGREGDIWLGVDRGGLARLRERQFQVIGPAEGLTARAALSVCEEDNGTVWFGTSGGGLCRWDGVEIQSYEVGARASANFVFSVFPQRGGGVWLSAADGEELFRFNEGRLERAPWEVHGVKVLLTDRAGRLWMGTKSGLNWWTPQRRRSFSARDGLSGSAVRALAEGNDGAIWCGGDDGALYRCGLDKVQAFRPGDALTGQPIWSLLADETGAIWAGTFRGGLLRFKAGQFARLTSEQGLPGDIVSGLLQDKRGNLWLGTHSGICKVSKSALNACADGVQRGVDCVTYGRFDGLPSLECSGNYQPTCWPGRDGRLWFGTVKGMVSFKPEELTRNAVPPPVVIEEFRVDGQRVSVGDGAVVLPPGRAQFEFRFTALSFIAPDKVRFRYRLEGLEANWVNVGARRSARYDRLPAGRYRFQVLACNNDGVWNETGATLAFRVRHFFYETWWFQLLAAVAVVGGAALSARVVTTRKYRATLARLEQQHAIERDRTRIAKDIHDDLGAGLTQITLLGELARREPPEQLAGHLGQISELARRMTRAMDEIVWAVDPQHDTLVGLLDYVSAFTEDFLRAAGLRCRMDLPATLPAVPVDAEVRYNCFLALKEALNNAVKHAHATEVRLSLQLEPGQFMLLVADNGQGILGAATDGNAARLASGHGLPNLEKRLSAIGGRCVVRSGQGQGTTIELTVPLAPAASPIVVTGQTVSKAGES